MIKKLLLVVLFLVGTSVYGHAALTAADVLSRARIYLNDQASSPNRQTFTDTQLLQFASDAQREANAQNWLLQSSTTITLVSGTTSYAMPSDFMFPNRVWYRRTGQPYIKLPAASMNDLDARVPGWFNVTGIPINYYMDLSGPNVYMSFYPAPNTSGVGPCIIYYIQNTTDLTSTSQIPFNGWLALQPYVSAMSYYVAYRGFLTLQKDDLANQYLQYWVNFMLLMRQGINRQPDFNPPAGAIRSGNPAGMGGLGAP